MSNPQQPELARSRKTPAQDQDAVAGVLDGQRDVTADAPRGPVPPENQPGHHPSEDQDKPDLSAFAEKLGTKEPSDREEQPAASATTGPTATQTPVAERRSRVTGVSAVAALLAAVLAVVVGRRVRSRRSRR